MPIFEYVGEKTGRIYEHLCSYKDRPTRWFDPETGEKFILKMSAPNLLKSQLESWQHGLSGFGKYDPDLGQTVYGEKHRDEILKAKGLVRESDLPKYFIEDKNEKAAQISAEMDKESDEFFARIKKFGLDKQDKGSDRERVKATEQFWNEQCNAKDVAKIAKINKQTPLKKGDN